MADHPLGKIAWITGASSGIGRALALKLASEGMTVAVSARTATALQDLAAAHANIRAFPLDVTNVEATAATVRAIESEIGPIDLAVLNAGIFRPMSVSTYDLAEARQSMDINYFGIINALAPLMPAMVARRRGHIAMIASVAGYRGLRQTIGYGPTKSAVINLGEGLYLSLAEKGVKVQVFNPGYIDTPMTEKNEFAMPFIISTDEAVDYIRAGLEKNKFEVVFPRSMSFLMKLLRIIRYKQYFRISQWV